MRISQQTQVALSPRIVGLFALFLLTQSAFTGCATLSPTERGVVGGAGIGTVAGALAGSTVGRPGAGAAIGALVGGASGGMIGNAVERSEERQAARLAASRTSPGSLGLTDVATLARERVSDDVIITQIRTTGATFQLSARDIVWLKENGVSDTVIREMQTSPLRPQRRVFAPDPYYPGPFVERVYVAEPYPPPPPVHFGVGVGFGSRCR